MTNFQFSLLRLASIPVALFLVLDWLMLPSQLQATTSVQHQASARYEKRKTYDYAVLQIQNQFELDVSCTNAGKLCARLRRAPLNDLQVWLHEPGLFHRSWLVAAKLQQAQLSGPEDTRSAYSQFKALWGAITLVLVAMAFVSWRFAPFGSERANAP
jgi:hypothetical protein